MNKIETIQINEDFIIDVFDIKEDGNGFDFNVYYIDRVSRCDLDYDNYEKVLFCHGIARYDGLRHLWFNKEKEPECYMYFPDFTQIKQVFDKLHELEIKYCELVN